MPKWQYRVEIYAEAEDGWTWQSDRLAEVGFEDGLQMVGEDGWELVSALSEQNEGRSFSSEYIFKREA